MLNMSVPSEGDLHIGLSMVILPVGRLELSPRELVYLVDLQHRHPLVAVIIEEGAPDISRPVHYVNTAEQLVRFSVHSLSLSLLSSLYFSPGHAALTLGILIGAHRSLGSDARDDGPDRHVEGV